MKKSGASQGQSASEFISKRIAELGDWRGETLSRMRKLIKKADPDVVEEWQHQEATGLNARHLRPSARIRSAATTFRSAERPVTLEARASGRPCGFARTRCSSQLHRTVRPSSTPVTGTWPGGRCKSVAWRRSNTAFRFSPGRIVWRVR